MEYLVAQHYADDGGELEQCQSISHINMLKCIVGCVLRQTNASYKSNDYPHVMRLDVLKTALQVCFHYNKLNE